MHRINSPMGPAFSGSESSHRFTAVTCTSPREQGQRWNLVRAQSRGVGWRRLSSGRVRLRSAALGPPTECRLPGGATGEQVGGVSDVLYLKDPPSVQLTLYGGLKQSRSFANAEPSFNQSHSFYGCAYARAYASSRV